MDGFEWLKPILNFTGEATAWGVAFYFAKEGAHEKILKPLDKLEKSNEEMSKNFINFTERVNSVIYGLMKDLKDNSNHYVKLLDQVTMEARQAMSNSGSAVERANAMERTVEKLVKIATAVHDTNRKITSEVQQISKDLIMIKEKLKSET